MPGRLTTLGLTLVAPSFAPMSGLAQEQPNPVTVSEASYTRARDLVEGAIEAMGGLAALQRLGGLSFQATGTLNKGAEHQGRTPDADSPGRFRETFSVDPANDRIAYDYREDRYDGTYESLREVYRGDEERLIVVLEAGFAVLLISPEHGVSRRRLYRRIPSLLLAEVADRGSSLRWVGETTGLEVVYGTLQSGEVVALFFDADSGTLSRVEYLTDIQSFGDAAVAWEFADYAPIAGLGLFPRRYTSYVEGRVFTDMTIDRVSPGAESQLF